MRLNEHFPLRVASPGAPRDLRQEIKRPFGGPEIRKMQRHIRVDHSHQRYLREVKPFCDHLRSDQDIQLSI